MKPALPALDFEGAKQFYVDLGFVLKSSGASKAEFQVGRFSFVLLNLSNKSEVHGVFMQLEVEDANAWWAERNAFETIKSKYPGIHVTPPLKLGSTRVINLRDPSGNMWHIFDKHPIRA